MPAHRQLDPRAFPRGDPPSVLLLLGITSCIQPPPALSTRQPTLGRPASRPRPHQQSRSQSQHSTTEREREERHCARAWSALLQAVSEPALPRFRLSLPSQVCHSSASLLSFLKIIIKLLFSFLFHITILALITFLVALRRPKNIIIEKREKLIKEEIKKRKKEKGKKKDFLSSGACKLGGPISRFCNNHLDHSIRALKVLLLALLLLSLNNNSNNILVCHNVLLTDSLTPSLIPSSTVSAHRSGHGDGYDGDRLTIVLRSSFLLASPLSAIILHNGFALRFFAAVI